MADVEPATVNFPHARTAVAVNKQTQQKQQTTQETRYFISSLEQHERQPAQWHHDIRGHWAGVEIRNHWRRDAIWMEDKTRSRNANIVGALALLRNSLLALVVDELDHYGSLPAFTEALCAKTNLGIRIIRKRLR